MSKQSEAKAKQGYVPKAIPQTCANCDYFSKTNETVRGVFRTYTVDRNLRCKLGGFAVKKMGTCDEFRGKPDQPEDIKRDNLTDGGWSKQPAIP